MKDNVKLKILIVDDIPEMREIFQVILCKEIDGNFIEATNGQEAIDILHKQSHEIDLVVCDFKMPIKNGLDVYNTMLDLNIESPFLLVTSEDITLFKNEVLTHENFFTLSKDYLLEDLSDIVTLLLHTYEIKPEMITESTFNTL